MVTLKIDNSTSQVTGLSVVQFKELKTLLSYDIGTQAAYFSGSRHNTKRSLLTKRGEFPTGLLSRIENWLPKGSSVVDLRKRPEALEGVFNLSLRVIPYDEQREASWAAVGASRGIICAPTGSGKSIMIAMVISNLKVPTLVVVPTLELKRQLSSFLSDAFGPTAPIVVQNVDALDPKVELKSIGLIIIDEFHHAAAKTYRELNKKAWKNVYYRIGFTATPWRGTDGETMLLESVLSDVIYELPYSTAVSKGHVVPVEAYYYTLPKMQMKGNDRDWRSVYNELIINNTNRNNRIAEVLTTLVKACVPTLCLVKEIAHGEILSKLTGIPFANGQDGNSQELIRQFNSGGIMAVIGTTGVIGEGVDTKPAEYVLLASTGKSKTQFMQNVGRGMRRYGDKQSAKIIMFKDPSHKYLTRHFNQCMLYLRDEYGIKAVKL